jgi:Tol biopolymer transport system component
MFQPDGHVRVNITNEPRYFEIQPQFSPDGRHIAFIRGTEPTAPTTVWVCRSDGRDARPLAVPQSETERFGSPVWLSDSSVCYVRDPIRNRIPDVELWQVDLSGSPPRRMFRFADVFKEGNGVITDVSPDGRQLAAIVQNQALSSTADVFVCDPQGGAVRKIWSDPHDDHKDSRALWSPDGRRIAWHHNLTAGSSSDPLRFGVGLARPGSNGEWTAELQPPDDPWVAPLAWSPRGDWLLCARIHSPELRASSATLFCLDDRFQTAQVLFELEPSFWVAAHRDLARLADWALVPDDAAPSRPGK